VDFHATHELLVSGTDLETSRRKTFLFFERNMLVRYDAVEIVEAITAEHPEFWPRIEGGEAANRKALAGMLMELRQEGYGQLQDILRMGQGYQSKMFHTIAHLLDGFFGIDTYLYNLVDDSHWLSRERRQKIAAAPHTYWLLKVAAASKGPTADRLHLLRSANWKKGE
jgi:hypothetical protein